MVARVDHQAASGARAASRGLWTAHRPAKRRGQALLLAGADDESDVEDFEEEPEEDDVEESLDAVFDDDPASDPDEPLAAVGLEEEA